MRIFGKLDYFFDDVISGQDDVTTVQFSMEVKILGWSFSNCVWIFVFKSRRTRTFLPGTSFRTAEVWYEFKISELQIVK